MADERPGQRAGDGVRRPAWSGRLAPHALTALLLLAAACDSHPSAPDLGGPLPFGEGATGTDSDGNGPGTSSGTIVGEWERFEAVALDGDIVTTTIHWLFDADGTCVRVITSMSANEGIPRSQIRECTWRLGPAEITLRLGTDAEATFPLEFGGFDPDRLILDGLEYQRVR
jgi:hypothetical protein